MQARWRGAPAVSPARHLWAAQAACWPLTLRLCSPANAAPPPPTPFPSAAGKSAERPVLSEEVIERNVRGIERTLRTLLQPPPGRCLPLRLPSPPAGCWLRVAGQCLPPWSGSSAQPKL